MRKEFLKLVAETFLENVGGEVLQSYCFVFPNRRSSLFFRKYLGQGSDSPIFSPTLITINDLFSQLSGLRTQDKTYLLYNLYLSFTKHIPDFNEKFDDFIYWGDMILNDFDDTDKYMADARKLFANINDLHQIDSSYDYLSEDQIKAIKEFWRNFIPFREGKKERSFITIWEKLFDIYSDFRKSLSERGEGYEGMSYRMVAEDISKSPETPDALSKYTQIVFVGLNALNNCEKRLLSALDKRGLADFYWDYFGTIIRDKDNKSSLFMDDNVSRYHSKYPLPEDGGAVEGEQNFHVIGIPSNVGQAKYVSKILADLIKEPDEENLFSTSIVLPDEKLLQPLLNSIPESIGKINVTMGYNLSNSNVATFMTLISALYKRLRLDGSKISYFYSTVLDILGHPFIKDIAPEDSKLLSKEIIERNLVFVAPEMLKGEPILQVIFNPLPFLSLNKKERIHSIAKYQLDILQGLQANVGPIEREFIYHYYTCINRLSNLDIEMEPDTYFRLLSQIVSSISIPFKGEPLSGLQVMGPLETRALDFENVIILSVNEGIFPSKAISSSFIPYNLRKGFDLPTYSHLDSISAYHFYRSIYRAKNIYLLYDTRTEGMKTGEVSRYVKQLKYHHGVNLKERFVTYKISTGGVREDIEIPKTEEMLSMLDGKSFSASSLNTYLSCPLKFYFQFIEGMKEADQVTENVEADTFGTLFHLIMENIYRPFQGRDVLPADLQSIFSDSQMISDHISAAFKEVMAIEEISGKNKIIEALLERYVVQTLRHDASIATFRYLSSEKRHRVPFDIFSGSRHFFLFGIIDRLDLTDGNVRVVDYKSGGVKMDFHEISELFDVQSKNRPYTAFQLILYLLILRKEGMIKDVSNTVLTVYSLRDIFSDVTPSFVLDEGMLDEFERLLTGMVESIFDLSVPFRSAYDERTCGYCPFKLICNK